MICKVSVEDYWLLDAFNWKLNRNGYCYRQERVDGKQKVTLLHRVITNAPEGMVVDHIDGDPTNNQRENLRVCTSQENAWNCRKPRNNSSGYKGVSKMRPWGKFEVNIRVNGKLKFVGSYPTLEDGAQAYLQAAQRYFGEFART